MYATYRFPEVQVRSIIDNATLFSKEQASGLPCSTKINASMDPDDLFSLHPKSHGASHGATLNPILWEFFLFR